MVGCRCDSSCANCHQFALFVACAVPMDARPIVATTTRFCIHPITHRLLQRRACWPVSLHACTSSACNERCSAVRRNAAGAYSRRRHHAVATLLPVAYRIRYKLCLMMYAVHSGTSPSYIADTNTRISTLSCRGRLRSAKTSEYDLPRIRTKLGERERVRDTDRDRERERERERILCGRSTRMERTTSRDQKQH